MPGLVCVVGGEVCCRQVRTCARERERGRGGGEGGERQTDRQTDRQRQTERDSDIETETDERGTHRDREISGGSVLSVEVLVCE